MFRHGLWRILFCWACVLCLRLGDLARNVTLFVVAGGGGEGACCVG